MRKKEKTEIINELSNRLGLSRLTIRNVLAGDYSEDNINKNIRKWEKKREIKKLKSKIDDLKFKD